MTTINGHAMSNDGMAAASVAPKKRYEVIARGESAWFDDGIRASEEEDFLDRVYGYGVAHIYDHVAGRFISGATAIHNSKPAR